MTAAVKEHEIYISYSQFLVHDKSEVEPQCEWTELTFAQGFARRASTSNFLALIEYGSAEVRVFSGHPVDFTRYRRLIAVPFCIVHGEVFVRGPEEIDSPWSFEFPVGCYTLYVGQSFLDDEHENIDLYFEKLCSLPLRSRILVADSRLKPPMTLCEHSGRYL